MGKKSSLNFDGGKLPNTAQEENHSIPLISSTEFDSQFLFTFNLMHSVVPHTQHQKHL